MMAASRLAGMSAFWRGGFYVKTALGLMLLVFSSSVGCSTSDKGTDPNTQGDDAGAEGTADVDAAVSGGVEPNATGLGLPCGRDSDCLDNLFCDEESTYTMQVPSAPAGVITRAIFPGGSCSPRPIGPYDPDGGTSCSLDGPTDDQGCGKGGVCIVEPAAVDTVVSCRVACEPSADASGCSRKGYTCDFQLHACIEGCAHDEDCRLLRVDSDGDGAADALEYDRESSASCDSDTGRCSHEGGATKSGGACRTSDECEADGLCITAESTLAGNAFPDGYCTKFGCEVEGRECVGDDSACVALRSLSRPTPSALVCMTSCRVGAESEGDRLGEDGHGEGCRPGYRCQYNGGAGASAGVCVGGTYNDVTDNNVGAACELDSDCYSPYGIGLCLALSVGDVSATTGTCSMLDCNAPGLPDDICGKGNACIGLSGDVTFCVQECDEAAECALGSACSDDDADPTTPSICYPVCFTDEECRSNEACELTASGAGQCVAMPGSD